VREPSGRSIWSIPGAPLSRFQLRKVICGSLLCNHDGDGDLDNPSACVPPGELTCTASFDVTESPCPTVSCSIIASSPTVTEGERVAFPATIVGPGRTTCAPGRRALAGRLSSTTGAEVTLSTAGVTGPITVRAMVTTDVNRRVEMWILPERTTTRH